MNEIVPITVETIANAPKSEKNILLGIYHDWLRRQRKRDKREAYMRIYTANKVRKDEALTRKPIYWTKTKEIVYLVSLDNDDIKQTVQFNTTIQDGDNLRTISHEIVLPDANPVLRKCDNPECQRMENENGNNKTVHGNGEAE